MDFNENLNYILLYLNKRHQRVQIAYQWVSTDKAIVSTIDRIIATITEHIIS